MSQLYLAGFEPQYDGNYIVGPSDAARIARNVALASVKNMTVVAFADALSTTGSEWLWDMGIRIDFRDWVSLAAIRQENWVGTPYLALGDFLNCTALLDNTRSFDPTLVGGMLWDLQMGYPELALEFRIAREGSPVIFVREASMIEILTAEQAQRLGDAMGASETELTNDGGVRFWFD